MKKTRTVKNKQEYAVCDFCESERVIGTCGLCGKDVCSTHGGEFDAKPYKTSYGFTVDWSPDIYKLILCNECQNIRLTAKEYVERFGATKHIKYIKVNAI